MRRLLPAFMFAVISAMLLVGCAGLGTEKTTEPYDYTHTTELKRFEIYESERIKGADRSAVVTLEQLGYGDLTLTGEEAESPTVVYTLPDDATQGPDTWYIFNLHFLIEFEDDTGNGFCKVAAKGGGLSVKFETYQVNGSPFIRVDGQSSNSTQIEVCYYNYMMTRSVKPGTCEMSFALEQSAGTRVRDVIIYRDSGIEATSTAPSDYEEGLKLSPEQQAIAKELAFKDTRAQNIAEGKEFALMIMRADGMVRTSDEPQDDDIEVRLVFARTYMIEDIEATALDVFVDLNEGAVTYLFPLGLNGMPELTASARERAVTIALEDAGVQQELEGKSYTVGKVGTSMGGPVGRLGANVLFVFDKPYPLDSNVPSVLKRQVTGVKAFVNLKEGTVVQVMAESAPAAPPGGER